MTALKKHNGKISFWKFIFALLIIAFHVSCYYDNTLLFKSGYIGVEFFFIVSGYYLCKKCINYKRVTNSKIGVENFKFILKKVKKLLPYMALVFVLSLPISIFIDKLPLRDYVNAFMNFIFLPNLDNKVFTLYGITWYIIAMLIIEAFLFPILLKYKKNYIYNISPLLIILSVSFLIISFGNISNTWEYTIFSYKGLIRAFMDINIGIFIYGLLDGIKKVKLTDFSKFFLTILEIIGFISIFYISCKGIHTYDVLMLIIISICLMISLSNKVYLVDFSNNKIFYYLEKISLPIYLNQFIFIELFEYIKRVFKFKVLVYWEILIVIIVSVIFAMIQLKVFDLIKRNSKKIKAIFIESN